MDYAAEAQHELARTFTLIMSVGFVGSFLAGWLMDNLGLQQCTLVLLVFGVCQAFILAVFHDHRWWMILGFVIYTQFRSLLFPLFVGSITSQLGFKYFGLLNGLGFAIAGIAQIFMASLVELTQGDCHLYYGTAESQIPNCNKGKWTQLHIVQACVLLVLTLDPVVQRLREFRRKQKIEAVLARQSPLLRRDGYGALLRIGEDNFDEAIQLTI